MALENEYVRLRDADNAAQSVSVFNSEMTKFVSEYFALASGEFAHPRMQEAKPRAAGNTWVVFRPVSLPPEEITLTHQLTSGKVKVLFNGQAESFDALQEKYKSKLPRNASIELAGKSVAISIEVPKTDPLSVSFSDQQEKVNQALKEVTILEKLVSENSGI